MQVMMSSGTLLGWLRHCDFLPHTPDLDFAVPAAAITPAWIQLARNLTYPFLQLVLGQRVPSLHSVLPPFIRMACLS